MPSYGPWTWSQPHGRHYSYLLADDGLTVIETLWAGPATGSVDTRSTAATHTYTPIARSVPKRRYTADGNVA